MMVVNMSVKYGLTVSSFTHTLSDRLTTPSRGAYRACSWELRRGPGNGRDVERWVPRDVHPPYTSIPGLRWSGSGHGGRCQTSGTSRTSYPLPGGGRKGKWLTIDWRLYPSPDPGDPPPGGPPALSLTCNEIIGRFFATAGRYASTCDADTGAACIRLIILTMPKHPWRLAPV